MRLAPKVHGVAEPLRTGREPFVAALRDLDEVTGFGRERRRLAQRHPRTGRRQHRAFEAAISTVAGLVTALGLDVRKVAVERNLKIVPRSTMGEVAVEHGDCFEIVTFVGGG